MNRKHVEMTGKRYAILIASSKFPEEPGLTELRCPENDVDALAEVLRSPDLGQFSEVVVLKNAPSYEVLLAVETILASAVGKDLVLIYFSGHGKTNTSGRIFFATTDTKLKTPHSTSVSATDLKVMLDESLAKRKILLMDCCYSGAVGKEFTKGGIDGELQLLSGGRGTFIMTASTSVQVAFEKEGDQHSLFTKHLLEGIRSGEADRDEDGWIDMAELHGYVREKLKEEGGQQEPLEWHLEGDGKLIISRSGTESRAKRAQAAKKMLFELAAQERLTEGIVLEAVQLLALPKREMTAKDQDCRLLIEQLAGGKLNPPLFTEQWLRTCFAHVGKAATLKQGDIMRDKITGIELVYIPAGCFMMGSDAEEHQDDERPVHKVCLDAFWMGKCQVTQVQWQKIMGKNPSTFQNGGTYPVEQVSWNDAQKFIAKLNKQSGKAYRLPTEAECEYACQAENYKKNALSNDRHELPTEERLNHTCRPDNYINNFYMIDCHYKLDAVAWYYKNSGGSTHPVGEKPANPFGLHDMLENVWEWCADRYLKNYYASSPEKNPAGPSSGNKRVLRGGCWIDDPLDCRVTFRDRSKPDDRSLLFGFLVVLPVR